MSSRSDVVPARPTTAITDPGTHTAAAEIFPRLPEVRRPDPALMVYYAITSLALGPFFLFALVPAYFKYHSLRYTVEEDGISMRWGVLFRREVSLNYARIQDIHLSSNVVERWLGLAKIQVQTASGSSSAEMTIEGLRDFEGVRDFLYGRMRGARDRVQAGDPAGQGDAETMQLLAKTLTEIASELRQLRRSIGPAADQESGDA